MENTSAPLRMAATAMRMRGRSSGWMAEKKALVTKAMELTDAEARAFWPLYDAFQKELGRIYDRRGRLVAEYAEAYRKGPLPDAVARRFMTEALAIDGDEHALKRSYIDKFSAALPGAKVLRYLLVENKINSALQFQVSNGLPLPQ